MWHLYAVPPTIRHSMTNRLLNPLGRDTELLLTHRYDSTTNTNNLLESSVPSRLVTLLIPVRGLLLPRAHLTAPRLCEEEAEGVELEVIFAVTAALRIEDAKVSLGGSWSAASDAGPHLSLESFEVVALHRVSAVPGLPRCAKSVSVAVVRSLNNTLMSALGVEARRPTNVSGARQGGEPPSISEGAQRVVPLPQLVLAGLAVSSAEATHFLLLSEAHIPLTHPKGDGFVEGLLKGFRSPPPGQVPVAVQCTILQASEADESSKNHTATKTTASSRSSSTEVVDKGFEVGWSHDTPTVVRRLAGHPSTDARIQPLDPVDFVSPFCALMDKEKFLRVGGLQCDEATSLTDQILASPPSNGKRRQSVEVVRRQILLLELIMQTLSLDDVRQGGNQLREKLNDCFKLSGDSTTKWEIASGRSFDRSMLKHRDKTKYVTQLLNEDAAAKAAFEQRRSILERITWLGEQLNTSMRVMMAQGRLRDTTSTEEALGWDLSMRFKLFDNSWRLLASGSTAVLLRELLPAPLLNYYQTNHVTPTFPSYMVYGSFEASWGRTMALLHRSRGGVPFAQSFNMTLRESAALSPPVRIYWHSFCCKCCGFSSEIAHYVYPLSRRRQIHLFNGESCFCKGYPSGMADSLQRAYTHQEHYLNQPRAANEVTIWISHTDPLTYQQALTDKRPPSYVVGRSMYEFSRVSKAWVTGMNTRCNEVWVPSSFVRSVFIASGVKPERIVTIPEAVDTYYYDPEAHEPLRLPLTASRPSWRQWENYALESEEQYQQNYRFYSNFKWEPRKGWDTLLTAYQRAFGGNSPQQADNTPPARVSLYIQTFFFNGPGLEFHTDIRNMTLIVDSIQDWIARSGLFPVGSLTDRRVFPHIVITTEHVSEADQARLYRTADAFVLPTRGEGWGLPTIQAMSMALPTISTNYGGNTDFMSPWTSYLIPIDGVEELDPNSMYEYVPGKRWSIPSVSGTQRLMRYVYDNREAARALGRRAREDIHRRYSEEVIADLVDARIEVIRRFVLLQRSAK
jgi:glycosyltransferase involved in cell wall biosynthesis